MPGIVDLTVSEFLRQLAAEQPTPGGGSVAALVGALGAGLVCMVCVHTIARERYRDVDDRARRLLARAQELQGDFERATEADAAAYQSFADAQRSPRDSQDQRAARSAAMQQALRDSTDVPLDVAAAAAELVGLARVAAEIGNESLISDAAVAASLAFAVFQSARLNVELNAARITDQPFAQAARERLAATGRAEDLDLVVRSTYRLIPGRTS
jgi:formiminotetrahydrofolate cyclodeaminase